MIYVFQTAHKHIMVHSTLSETTFKQVGCHAGWKTRATNGLSAIVCHHLDY